MNDIFISYRREDSRADAGRLYDHLSSHFGADRVFMDIDDIAPGEDFPTVLETTLDRCRALIVLIGPSWHGATDSDGRPRLFQPGDYVRLEIETALLRAIPIIPVLVGGAEPPGREWLPASLAPLARRQAVEIDDGRYRGDMALLLARLNALIESPPAPRAGLRSSGLTLSTAEVKAMIVTRDYYDADWNASGRGTDSGFQSRVAGLDLVVFDPTTKLSWQKGGSARPMVFESAVEQVREMNAEGFAQRDDWRIPTLEEAMSLMTAETRHGYHISAEFESRGAPIMWTCDTTESDRRWVVYFHDGFTKAESARFSAHLRAVAGGAAPASAVN